MFPDRCLASRARRDMFLFSHISQTAGELSSWLQKLLKTAPPPVNWSSASELFTTGWWLCFVRPQQRNHLWKTLAMLI